MRRRLFNFTAAVSLVLCLATAVLWLWVIAFNREFGAVHYGWYSIIEVRDVSNGLELEVDWHRRWGGPFVPHYARRGGDPNSATEGWNFTYYHFRGWEPVVEIHVPDWSLMLLFALLPVAWFISHRRTRRRARQNGCVSCGYNLTSNTSGVCPECGTPVAAKVVKA